MKRRLLILLLGVAAWAAPGGRSQAEALRLGERMYREGILPSGRPMKAVTQGDIAVSGTPLTCASCHQRSGLGAFEGRLVTLPTNGAKLYQPAFKRYPNLTPADRVAMHLADPPRRPAYTDATLARALREGVDPAGRTLHPVMPRYRLAKADMALLVGYLRHLSSAFSPGVTDTELRLATVITDEVTAEEREAFETPLRTFLTAHNGLGEGGGNRMYQSLGGQEMALSHRRLVVDTWRLSGPPATWADQLAAYEAKAPVFALVGGLTHGSWAPIHAFCEARQLPCLLPLTPLPVVSAKDWYTVYFSKGPQQEGEAVARFLRHGEGGFSGKVLELTDASPAGAALRQGFHAAWKEAGGPDSEVTARTLPESQEALADLLRSEAPAVVLWWADPARLPLAGLPARTFVSGSQLGEDLGKLPEALRPKVWLTWPYRDPKEEPAVARRANALSGGLEARHFRTRIPTRTYTMIELLKVVLGEMDRNFYRDNFLDRLAMLRDLSFPDYERLSFGPGQRYLSKGCYVVQLGAGEHPEVLKRSPWVIQ